MSHDIVEYEVRRLSCYTDKIHQNLGWILDVNSVCKPQKGADILWNFMDLVENDYFKQIISKNFQMNDTNHKIPAMNKWAGIPTVDCFAQIVLQMNLRNKIIDFSSKI